MNEIQDPCPRDVQPGIPLKKEVKYQYINDISWVAVCVSLWSSTDGLNFDSTLILFPLK